MHRLQEMVRLHRMGLSARKLAIALKMGRNTLRDYLAKLDVARLLDGPQDSIPELCTLKSAIRRQIVSPETFEGGSRPSSAFGEASAATRDFYQSKGHRRQPVLGNAANIAIETFAIRYELSPKETLLLELAVTGKNNDEAAEALGCRRPTVSSYWHRIFTKSGHRSQRDVIAGVLCIEFTPATFTMHPFHGASVTLDPNGSDVVIDRTT